MPWVRIDDNIDDHPKFRGLSDAAIGGFTRCLAWCSRNLTDGAIPAAVFPTLVRTARGRAELLDAGMLVRRDTLIEVHDYLDYQPSKEDVLRQRAELCAARAESGRKGGIASGRTRQARKQTGSKPEANPNQTPSKTEAPIPYPAPVRGTCVDPVRTDDDVRLVRPSSSSSFAPALVTSSLDYDRLRKTFAYVGARLRVPHRLHDECRAKLGGEHADTKLRAWYELLDTDLQASGEPVADIFDWLRPQFKAWCAGPPQAPAWARTGQAELDPYVSPAQAQRERAAQRTREAS